MKAKVTCPACGADDLDVRAYDSLMALRELGAGMGAHEGTS